jgi:hypothetical protein
VFGTVVVIVGARGHRGDHAGARLHSRDVGLGAGGARDGDAGDLDRIEHHENPSSRFPLLQRSMPDSRRVMSASWLPSERREIASACVLAASRLSRRGPTTSRAAAAAASGFAGTVGGWHWRGRSGRRRSSATLTLDCAPKLVYQRMGRGCCALRGAFQREYAQAIDRKKCAVSGSPSSGSGQCDREVPTQTG